ncbi:hypothetical protein PCE1_001666 [Barthelona sp. PCE]
MAYNRNRDNSDQGRRGGRNERYGKDNRYNKDSRGGRDDRRDSRGGRDNRREGEQGGRYERRDDRRDDRRGGFRGGSRGGSRGGPRGGGRGGRDDRRGGRDDRRGGRDNRRGGRDDRRGGRDNRGGFKKSGRSKIEPFRYPGVFIKQAMSNREEEHLLTLNMVPGVSVYQEKRVSQEQNDEKVEYREWNPYRSKLGAAAVKGVSNLYIEPGTNLLYLGAANGTTVSHCSDIVGADGVIYAVEFSTRSGRDLLNVASKRDNIVPLVEDARHPHKYRTMVGMCDTIFSDVAQPDQARICAVNAQYFLKNGGYLVMSVKADCIDSTVDSSVVVANQIDILREEGFEHLEHISLEPFERNHTCIFARYRPQTAKAKNEDF